MRAHKATRNDGRRSATPESRSSYPVAAARTRRGPSASPKRHDNSKRQSSVRYTRITQLLFRSRGARATWSQRPSKKTTTRNDSRRSATPESRSSSPVAAARKRRGLSASPQRHDNSERQSSIRYTRITQLLSRSRGGTATRTTHTGLYLLLVFLLAGTFVSADTSPPPTLDRKLKTPTPKLIASADSALEDQFTFQGVTGSPTQQSGTPYDWNHQGPKNDKEWAWFLNRHRFFEILYVAYEKTGNSTYRDKIYEILEDWIDQESTPPTRISFSSSWRALEAARRILESWDIVYLNLFDDETFPEDLRPKFLEAFDAHGDYLIAFHAFSGNHLITEMIALLKLSIMREEAANSPRWRQYALEMLDQEYHAQFYPTGTHKELSAHYQRVVILNFDRLLQLLRASDDRKALSIWEPRIARMWQYLADIRKPNGFAPLNNNADLEHIPGIFRSKGKTLPPLPTESLYFPEAGHVIFRTSAPKTSPLWAFFDVGPRGTDHQHEDHLHLSLSIGKFDFLVDNGRYNYAPSPWRDYFRGPQAHNVLLVDGHQSTQKPEASDSPLPGTGFVQENEYDAAWGTNTIRSNSGSPIAEWQRNIILLPNIGILVLDHLTLFRNREVSGFWHGHPDTQWLRSDWGYTLANSQSHLGVTHANTARTRWKSEIKLGKQEPEIQGWYSPKFNKKIPAPALEYQIDIDRPSTLGWLFSPIEENGQNHKLTSLERTKTGELIATISTSNASIELRITVPNADQVLTVTKETTTSRVFGNALQSSR